MSATASGVAQTAIDITLAAIFISLELSRDRWMITSLSPGKGERMSKHSVDSGDVAGLLNHFRTLQAKAQANSGCGSTMRSWLPHIVPGLPMQEPP